MIDGEGREAGDQHNHGSGTFVGRVVGDVTVNYGTSASRPAQQDASAPCTSTESRRLAEAADQLAQAVGAQWRREEERQRVHDPFPLPVRWHLAPEALMDHWANIRRGPAGVTFGPLALTGQLDRVVDVYQRIPSGRLMVLGRVGSGKTVLTLRFVLDLLDARTSTDLVPVIFGLGSWNPTTTSLRDWLTDQLLRDHPGLAAPGPTGSSLAAALVEAGRILPVLDGFDEIADGLHRAALEALNATRMPLLLTSRPDEYATAVAAADVLTAAAGIELDDLTLTDLADYLPRTTRKTATGSGSGTTTVWDPVLARLCEHPSSPAEANLTAVLSTPLMVVLARTVYSDTPDRDPAELLDTHQFGTAQDLEDHLLGAFVPAVYQHPPLDRRFSHRGYRSWDPDRVQHWLGYLAWHLNRLGTKDLAWWQLGNTLSRTTRMLVGGLVIGLAAALANGLTNGLLIGFVVLRTYLGWDGSVGLAFPFTDGLRAWLVYGLVSGLAGGLVAGIALGLRFGLRSEGGEPSRIQLHIRGRARQVLEQLTDGVIFGFAAWLVIGLASGLAGVLARQIIGWRTFGLVDVIQAILWIGPRFGLVVGLVFGLAFALQTPADIRIAVSPSELLTANRKNAVFQSFVGWLAFGLALGFLSGLANALVGGFVWGFVVRLSMDAWGRWLILSRIWLPMTGRLPRALIAFLDDAHQRGMLRQVGSVYQFRHARLQNHFAHLYETRGDQQSTTPWKRSALRS
ncbi:NACHT domain-containing protein [Streptomyces sp. ISL-98]|uniref:NACHT domain-containing protein n=1 Tax=Streptomyces sp. ISL-98 TaxID=2819192 RepID=UPI001BE864E7|nr:NACHT domain-containing protein [Streptomyces sp. ISL-98]MBT2510591.1 NACHT domain-containing protein [Streptomyces sp. ISL-98]